MAKLLRLINCIAIAYGSNQHENGWENDNCSRRLVSYLAECYAMTNLATLTWQTRFGRVYAVIALRTSDCKLVHGPS